MVEGEGFEPPNQRKWVTATRVWPLRYPSIYVVLTKGLEPSTYWLLVNCSTNWAKSAWPLYRYLAFNKDNIYFILKTQNKQVNISIFWKKISIKKQVVFTHLFLVNNSKNIFKFFLFFFRFWLCFIFNFFFNIINVFGVNFINCFIV